MVNVYRDREAVYTKTVTEIIEHKNEFLTHLLLPTITILTPNDRTAVVVAFSCRQIKLLKEFV